jgi:predicted  nucleic acid-binding Zn-ribbon protein
VRAEAHQRVELEAQTNKNMRNELQKSLKDITANVSRLEGAVHAIPQLEARLNATDKRMTDIDNRQLDIEVTSKTTQVDMNNRMGRLESVKDELFALIESTRASISRVTFDVEENNTRVNSYINGIETRLTESVDSLRDDLTREVNAVHAKAANQADELRRLVEAKNAEMVASTRQQYKALSEELDSTRRRWATNYDALSAHVKEDTDRKVGRLQQTLTQTVGDLRASHNKQAGFMCDLEEKIAAQLEALQTQLRDLSTTHRTHAQTVTDTHEVLEGRLQELTTTMHAPVYPQQPGYTWVGPPGTPAGMAASFRVPEDFSMGGPQGPPSPISRAQDRSFMHPQDAHSAVNTSTRYHSHTPGAAQSSSFHESAFRQPALSGNTSVVTAKSAASRRATSSPGRGGTSPSASRGNPETDRKRRETKKAGAVDIVQKFLEIYENDQKDITQRCVLSISLIALGVSVSCACIQTVTVTPMSLFTKTAVAFPLQVRTPRRREAFTLEQCEP